MILWVELYNIQAETNNVNVLNENKIDDEPKSVPEIVRNETGAKNDDTIESTPLSEFEIKDNKLIKYNGTATHAVIPNSVTGIGINAFRDCNSLQNITIPNSVTRIGDCAFWGGAIKSFFMSNRIPML